MSLRLKFILALLIIITVTFSIFFLVLQVNNANLLETQEEKYATLMKNAVDSQMNSQLQSARMSVLSLSENPEIQRAFYDRDRDALIDQLLPVYDRLKADVAQIQFHLPDSSSFLRLHMPEKYGDSLKDFRFTVNETNANKKMVMGLEEGRGGYGFRVVVPMFYKDVHTGSLEYGSGFDENFLLKIQNDFHADYFIYRFENDSSVSWDENGEEASFLAATLEKDRWPIAEATIENVQKGNFQSEVSKDGQSLVLLMPYRDYKGQAVGYIKSIVDRSETAALEASSLLTTLISIILIAMILVVIIGLMSEKLVIKPIQKVSDVIKVMASGDLTQTLNIHTKDEFGQLSQDFTNMIQDLKSTLSNVHEASNQVALGSDQVSESSTTLSQGATQQASAVEELTASVEKVVEQTIENARYSDQSRKTALEAKDKALEGKQQMENLLSSMDEIKHASGQIDHIIKVIDDIAFQTNILALNAAVEAARAGVHGKGFAVVAEEVRSLASKSSQAAKESTALIELSNKKIHEGKEKSQATAESLYKIVAAIEKTTQGVDQITQATDQQKLSMEEIQVGINQVSDVVQMTSATSQETASASEELASQAQLLKNQIEHFKI